MSSIHEEIIVRSLQKTATAEELEILNEWLKKDRKNADYYFQLETIWYSKEKLPGEMVREGWERLSEDIEKSQRIPVTPFSRKPNPLIWLRYIAAVFIGILIASAALITFLPGEPEKQDLLIQHVVYNQTGVQLLILPDSSVVWMNENAKISYPEVFAKGKREVSFEGKAYFDVRKKPDQPFVVHVGAIEIEVTGTEFFVESVSAGEDLVTLVSGGVTLNSKDRKGQNLSTPLLPGQQASIDKLNGDIRIAAIDTGYYLTWKDGTYRFEDEPLETISALLEKRFDLEIQVASSLKRKRFTGRITSGEKIEDVLVTINKSYPVKYRIAGRTVTISEQ